MITVLTGDNAFEIERALGGLAAAFDGIPERVDGADVDLRQLPDLLMGATLFADQRLVIIKSLSQNKAIWDSLTDWLPRLTDDIHVILVEPSLDKRTKTYKALQKTADIRVFTAWGERDTAQAEAWVRQEAAALGIALDKKSAHTVVARVGTDQWPLWQALQKLAVMDEVTPGVVESLIDASPTENVFYLFEAALKGERQRVAAMIATLSLNEDPYRVFGLLSGQAFQLAVLAAADKPSNEVAKDLGAHPFALGKLTSYATTLGRAGAGRVIAAFAEADSALKTSAADPWLLLERALVKVAQAK